MRKKQLYDVIKEQKASSITRVEEKLTADTEQLTHHPYAQTVLISLNTLKDRMIDYQSVLQNMVTHCGAVGGSVLSYYLGGSEHFDGVYEVDNSIKQFKKKIVFDTKLSKPGDVLYYAPPHLVFIQKLAVSEFPVSNRKHYNEFLEAHTKLVDDRNQAIQEIDKASVVLAKMVTGANTAKKAYDLLHEAGLDLSSIEKPVAKSDLPTISTIEQNVKILTGGNK